MTASGGYLSHGVYPTLDLVGDAAILLTAPFVPKCDLLDSRFDCQLPKDEVLETEGRLVRISRSLDPLMKGSLTYGNPRLNVLLQFGGSASYHLELEAIAKAMTGLQLKVTLSGILFSDGFGSVALRIDVSDGWEDSTRRDFIRTFGPLGRDAVAAAIRRSLLPVLNNLIDRCSPHGSTWKTLLPYFNLTYVASTTHPAPGRTTMPDELRMLVYPRSAQPIISNSPWCDEFFFAGYAYLLLVSANSECTLTKLELLLLNLNVLYARLDRSADSADMAIRDQTHNGKDVDCLDNLAQELRADYQALVRPTFSFDHHVLKLRDAILDAWDADKTRERTDMLLLMARQTIERRLAQQQVKRLFRLNVVVVILTILSLIATAEAAVNLWGRFIH